MKILLDTHCFLWWLADHPQMSAKAREILVDPKSELFLSSASSWEICLKTALGRLRLPADPRIFIPEQMAINRIRELPIEIKHTLLAPALPNHHRDPFDRILVAQAQIESLPLLSADADIKLYSVQVLW